MDDVIRNEEGNERLCERNALTSPISSELHHRSIHPVRDSYKESIPAGAEADPRHLAKEVNFLACVEVVPNIIYAYKVCGLCAC
jgi:hypothetical protein